MNENRSNKAVTKPTGGMLRGLDAAGISDTAAVRLLLLVTTGLAVAALPQLFEQGKHSGHTLGTYSTQWLGLLGVAILLAIIDLALLILSWTDARLLPARRAIELRQRLGKSAPLSILGAFLVWGIYVFVVLYRYQKHLVDFLPQVWLFFLCAGIGAFFVQSLGRKMPYFGALLLTSVFYGAGIKALGYLPDISSFPFSLSWSEGSRYYYASLPYSHWLYGQQFPLSFLHPSRYLLQSIAFWAPGAGIAFHRFWQVALWLALSLLTGLTLTRRFKRENNVVKLAGAVWAALFLLEGPVYYHLLVCVILVLWGFDRDRFWKTMIFVALGSMWAGISRVNWIPVPAMVAATLYLLEKPVCASRVPGKDGTLAESNWLKTWWSYLWPPLAWGVAGGAAALAAQSAYVLVSGHVDAASKFGSSFTSALLWYRLFPSPTFWLGVLPAIILVSSPMLALVALSWLRSRDQWHPLRVWGIIAMAGVLFVGGLIVSTKIGGGSNIHNLDAFSVLLLVVSTVIGMGGFASETGGWARAWRPWPLLLIAVVLPVVWNLNIGDPFVRRDFKQANYDLSKLNALVEKYSPKGEVLFITQRQLEIYNFVPGVRMVPDYELLTLTEMAISNNTTYFDRFYQDLQNHRFALIVADQQFDVIKDPKVDAFAEENNAWVEHVSRYLMKYYHEEMFFSTQGIQLLVPR